ncbi:MAG TPA: GNAT family N-acetyltransferase [Tepidiformaceae bacterium]
MPAVSVVPVAAGDAEAIAELARDVWYATYPGIISVEQIEYMLGERYTPEVIRREIETAAAGWDQVQEDGRPAAFVSYFPAESAGDLKVDKLYVAQAAQRKGYGGVLLDHVAEVGRQRGFRWLILAVNKHNEQAIHAYRKHRFRVRDAVTKDIGGGFVMDDFIMERAIPGASPK